MCSDQYLATGVILKDQERCFVRSLTYYTEILLVYELSTTAYSTAPFSSGVQHTLSGIQFKVTV